MDKAILTPLPGREDNEWHVQWSRYRDDALFLFEEWISPATLEDFRDKVVLECGCGSGQHTGLIATVARSVTAVDKYTADIAKARNPSLTNVQFVEADLGTMELNGQFDVVVCIGVIHHTDDPDRTFDAIYRCCKPGGKVIVWCYSAEGNGIVRFLVEPVRRSVLRHLPRRAVQALSVAVTAMLYPVVHSIYRLPYVSRLPYYEYFGNFRRLSFDRNVLNVFDKLNAPQTTFIPASTCRAWFNPRRFSSDSISIRRYKGVSWSLVGTKAI